MLAAAQLVQPAAAPAAPAEPAAEEAAPQLNLPRKKLLQKNQASTSSGGGDAGDAQVLKDSGDVDGMLRYCHSVDS